MGKKMNAAQLLGQLEIEVHHTSQVISDMCKLDNATLCAQPAPGKWSIAQIVEHLNTYNRYYIPLIQNKMETSGPTNGAFSPGWLGNYFTKSMYSQLKTMQQVTNKMSAMKGHIPGALQTAQPAISEFLSAEKDLLRLIGQLKTVDMNRARIPITISPLIRIKLGDALRFLIAHQQRHTLQIINTMSIVSSTKIST